MHRISVIPLLIIFIFLLAIDGNAFNLSGQHIFVEHNDVKRIESHDSTISHELNSLKEFINSSLWALHLSNNLGDQEASQTAEQIYSQSLEENKRLSEAIATKIVEQLKEGNDGFFFSFTHAFEIASSNEKKGLGILSLKLKELLLDSKIPMPQEYLSIVEKMLAESNASQVTFPESISIADMVHRFGMYVVGYHHSALYELLVSKDHDEFAKKKRYIVPAYSFCAWLNHNFLTQPTERETVNDVYDDAQNAKDAGNYQQAITLFRKVLKMDYEYGTDNGCYQEIGFCYQMLNDYDNAMASYEESIVKDSQLWTKKYSFQYAIEWHIGGNLPQTEDTFLKAIQFCYDVIEIAPVNEVRQDARFQIGQIYYYNLARLDGISDSKKEDYLLKAIDANNIYISEYQDYGDNPHADTNPVILKGKNGDI